MKFYGGHSIDASSKIPPYLAERFQRRFKKIEQPETRIAKNMKNLQELASC